MSPCQPRVLEGRLYCAGQPDAQDLERLAADGVRWVVNLRPPSELAFDEADCVRRLGMHYVNIPVATPADLNRANARALHDALARAGEDAVLLHCGTSNRVGALIALAAAWEQGVPAEDALALGQAAGLASLEPAVRARLDLPLD